ncbi:hypothetical protein BDP27DRAFT_1382570 [Rhodocollybia butyracea]|uniref:Mediator complex subunit 27 n=1 Tax=Rhodocollybia butyracea TaxID=206335 RepID=A0A9P5UAI2_9AGAR|nr:hypothetical protein BDP27DRAFT_1382570 [Rhodocollybia butyracea]
MSPSPVENQLQALTDLYNSIQNARHIPRDLLKTAIVSNALPLAAPSLSLYSQQLKDIAQTLRSDTVQTALRAALESAKSDSQNITNNVRRENRKRRRPPSPESPQPYIVTERQSSSLFLSSKDDITPLKNAELINYIRQFNKEHSLCKLGIWQATRSAGKALKNPTILRFSIKDVLTAYITVSYTDEDHPLAVESVTAFGPRERKLPHSQSDYAVFRTVSQFFGRMIHSDPLVGLQRFMTLLCSYESMFTTRCDKCQRVLSSEGHVAAVERVWNENTSHWEARHVSC